MLHSKHAWSLIFSVTHAGFISYKVQSGWYFSFPHNGPFLRLYVNHDSRNGPQEMCVSVSLQYLVLRVVCVDSRGRASSRRWHTTTAAAMVLGILSHPERAPASVERMPFNRKGASIRHRPLALHIVSATEKCTSSFFSFSCFSFGLWFFSLFDLQHQTRALIPVYWLIDAAIGNVSVMEGYRWAN